MRALRTMRVLRPLRVISRVPELKVVVNALFRSLPGLGNVLLVSLLFWLIFGILGKATIGLATRLARGVSSSSSTPRASLSIFF